MMQIVGRHFDMILGKSSLPQLMGQEWKLHRRLIAKAFSFQHLQHMVKDMNCMGDKFAAALLNGTNEITSRTGDEGSQCVVDVSMACKAVTLDIIGSTVFGFDFDTISTSLDHNPIAMAFDFLLSELTRRQFGNPLNLKNYFYSYPCESNRKFKEAKEVINSTLTKLIADKQLELTKDPTNSSVSEHHHHDILR
jgi:cytochrome P450